MSIVRIKYDKNEHQVTYHGDDQSKFLHLSSGFGGGKSYGLAMKAFKLSFLNRGIPGGCVVTSIADYKKDLLPIFEDILEINRVKYRYHKTDKWFLFPWSRAKMYVSSAEKTIRGPNWGWAALNEVTLMPHVRYKETVGRVRIRGAPCPQIASSGTPEGYNWLYDIFVERPMPGSRIIYGDTRNNAKNLADDYIPSLLNSYDTTMLDAYLKGLFVNMGANRFYYAYDPSKNLDKSIRQIPDAEIHVSMDFNVDPMTANLWNIVPLLDENDKPLRDQMGQPVRRAQAFGSIHIGGPKGADTHMMAEALLARGCHPDITTIYPDPAGRARSTSGPPDIEILRSHGFHKIRMRNVAPQFRRRQLAVNNLLEKSLIVVNPDECQGLKKDLESNEQDPVSFGKIKTNPNATHHSDGLDYFVDIEFPLSGHKPESKSVKFR